MIFLDTSGAYALADTSDRNHDRAVSMLEAVRRMNEPVVTHNYVLVESAALMHKRLGRQTAVSFLRDAAVFEVRWIDEELHRKALELLARSRKSGVSFVDAVSFLIMREGGLNTYLGFDQHFSEEGFHPVNTGD